jgi:hypothetical protein
MNSFYEHFKRYFFILLDAVEVFLDLPIALFTLYSLGGAFLPYRAIEENLAYLLLFMACASYWVWKYLARNEEISFWKSF